MSKKFKDTETLDLFERHRHILTIAFELKAHHVKLFTHRNGYDAISRSTGSDIRFYEWIS